MSLFWVLAYYPFTLIAFYAKYISGSIFTKYYLSGLSNVLSCFLAILLINNLGNRSSLFASSTLYLIAVVFLTLFETEVIKVDVESPDSDQG